MCTGFCWWQPVSGIPCCPFRMIKQVTLLSSFWMPGTAVGDYQEQKREVPCPHWALLASLPLPLGSGGGARDSGSLLRTDIPGGIEFMLLSCVLFICDVSYVTCCLKDRRTGLWPNGVLFHSAWEMGWKEMTFFVIFSSLVELEQTELL